MDGCGDGGTGLGHLPSGSLFATRLAEEVVALLAERDQHMAAGSWGPGISLRG